MYPGARDDPFAAYAVAAHPPATNAADDPFAAYLAEHPTTTPPKGQRAEGSSFSEKIANAAKMLGQGAPIVGGIVGGYLGSVPGAVAGGAAGEGYKQLAEHATELPGAIADVARGLVTHPIETARGFVSGTNRGAANTAMEGGAQGVGQLGGEALAAGATGLSKWLMNRATSRVTTKLMQDFPELSDTLIDNALTVSKGGHARARALLMEAKGKANAALKVADDTQRGIPIQFTPDIAESLKTALLEKAIKSGAMPPVQSGEPLAAATSRLDPTLRAMFDNIDRAAESGGVGHVTPSQADLLKTQLQKESRALYANRVAPNGPKAMGMDATERAELASRLNDAIGELAPGYRAANAEARPLIGATRGIQQAIRPSGNLYQAMVRPAVGAALGGAAGSHEGGPGSIAGAAIGAYATSPRGMSQEAILFANPYLKAALRGIPKVVADRILESIARRSENQP